MRCYGTILQIATAVLLLCLSLAAHAVPPVPEISTQTPSESFAGEQFCFDTILANNTNGDPGFSPYYRLILPPDISLDSVTFLESGISSTLVGVFTAPGNELTDPVIDAPVSGNTGDSLYTISLPVGSVVTGGPDLTVNFCMTIDSAATIGTPLDIIYQPVYALGDTATGDNGPVLGATVTDPVTPTLIIFDKVYNGPEGERTPGPSFPFTFTLAADVANGKTVENLIFTDTLPADLQFVGPIIITGGTGCSVTTSPSLVPPLTPGGLLSVSCTSVTGTTADQDVTVAIPVYVIDTLDENNCATKLITNTATLDFEFPAGTPFPQLSEQDQLTAKHLAIQKSASPGSPATATPGQTITYTNSIQLSDYTTAADDLIITDVLPDGTTFDAHTSLVIGAMTVPIAPTVTHNADGTTTLVYDIHTVTGNIVAGATATLTYTATIDQAYEFPVSPVLAADSMTNNITADYSLTDNANNCSDASSATVLIEPTVIRKTIVNPQAEYMPGDVVTYRLEMDIPSGDTSDIVFEDFFPLPVFDVNSLSLTFGDDVTHSPSDSLVLVPVLTRDASSNSLIITWPDVSTTSLQTLAVDIAITVEDEPFADDLSLTNLFVASSENTINTLASEVKPVQFKIRAPSVTLTKGISFTSNGDSTLTPAPGSPVDSDLNDADAGDTVTFVITAENTGGAPAYQLTITDPAVTGLANCSLITVTDGINVLAFTPAAATSLTSGIELDNPVLANSMVFATVTCDIDTTVSPQQIITNTASATWRSQSGSIEFPAVTDDATITIAQPTIEKTIESVAPGLQYPSQVTAGDVITYRLKITLTEGNTNNLVLTDTLPAGFTFQSAVIDSTGFNGTASIDSATAIGQTVTVTMAANTSTTADNDTTNNSFSVLMTALVDGASASNSATNAPQQKNNTLSLDYTGRSGTISSSVSTQFIEPSLALVKTMSPDRNLEAGDTVTITLAVTNNGSSPAYDVVVTDILNDVDNLFDLATVTAGTTPAGYTYSLVGGNTVTYTSDNSVPLASGSTDTFTFTAKVRPDIESGSSFDNTASVAGDSQPGVVSGERDSTDVGNDTVSTRKVRNKKIIISSSEAWTSDDSQNTQAAIGEILRYQVVIRVPEGITLASGSLITDRLPVDFKFQAGTATIRGVYDTSLTEGGALIPTIATLIVPAISGRDMSFNLGDLQNNDNDADIEQIIVEYDVLVLNTASNNAGDQKRNRFRLNFLNADGNAQSSTARRTITLVEPQLSATKQAQPSTVQGGTQTQFTVVLSNQNITNSTRAWELVITDQLPTDYINPQIVSATLSRGAVDISACAGFTGNLLSVDSSCLAAAERYLDPGENYTVVYTADVTPTVQFEQQITNTASGTASSLPGDQGTGSVTPGNPGDIDGERTGSGVGTNDLQTSAQATVIADKPTITKSGDASLQIGETTTMTLMIGVPIGTTNNFVLTDDLPTGLSFAGNYSLSIPAGINSTLTPGAPANGTDPVVLDFGSITNTTAQPLNIAIKYDVVVDNILSNQDTTQLTNTASLNFQNADQNNLPTDTATTTVIEANLEISKLITSGAANAQAGDTVSYQLTVTNTGTFATAYQVDFTDILPAGLLGAPDGSGSAGVNFTQIIVDNDNGAIVKNGGGALADTDVVFSTTSNPNDTLGFPLFDIPAGKTLTINYSAIVANTVQAGDTINNNTFATYDSLQAGGGRNADDNSDDDTAGVLDNYQESDTATVEISSDIAIQKTLNSGHAGNDFTIGDLITFDIQVDVIEGITTAVVVTDILPAGLEFEGPVRIIADPNISYSGTGVAMQAPANTLTINMGTVTNTADANTSNDQFTIEIDARVKDIPANMDGDSLTNSASVATGNPLISAGPDTAIIDIVEPNLQISKTPDAATVTLGDIVTFTINVDHVNSHADAFDVSLSDLIPAGMTYVAGSHQGDGVVDESNLAQPAFDLGTITLVDMGKQFSFQATIDNDATISLPITNTMDVAYSSQAGAPTDDRPYTGSGSGVVTPVISNALDAMKTVALVVDAGIAGQVDPGDTLEYTVTLTNTLDPLNNVVFTDTMPANTTYVAGSLITSAGITDDSAAPDLLVDVGDMATNAVVTVTFQVTVDAGTPTGTVISNQGSVDSDQTTPEPTDVDGIDGNGDQPTDIPVGPVAAVNNPLYVQKIVNWLDDADASADITAGDTLRYTLIIENNGNQPLTNISVTDTIPAGLTFVGGSDSITGAGTINVAGSAVSIAIPNIPAGDFEIAEFDVTVDAFALQTTSFVNQANTDSDQTTPGLSDSNGDGSDGNQPTTISAVNGIPGTADLDLQKRWSLFNDANGNGSADELDVIQYTITLTNTGAGIANNVFVDDTIPANASIIPGSVASSQGIVISEDPVSVNVGNVNPAENITITLQVEVDAGTPGGTIISNQAFADADNTPAIPSDDNGDPSDGLNPVLTPVTDNNTSANPAIMKSLVSSDLANSVDPQLVIGEIATFQITFNFPAGQFSEISLLDTLPAGLAYVSGSAQLARVFDTGVTASTNPAGINNTASAQFVSLNDASEILVNDQQLSVFLGDVIVSDADNQASYQLRYQTQVINKTNNQAATNLNNAASLSFLDGLSQPQSLTPVLNTVSVIEPDVQIMKTANPPLVLTSGGLVEFTVVVSNPGSGVAADAFDVNINDTLSTDWSQLNVISLTPSSPAVLGVVDNSAGTTLDISINLLPVDETLTIVYSAQVASGLAVASIRNTANSNWSSLPGTANGERDGDGNGANDYVASSTAFVNIGDAALQKSIINQQDRYAVGDIISYQLVFALPPAAVLNNAVLNDVLDAGLELVSGSLQVITNPSLSISAAITDFTRSDNTPTAGLETLSLNLGTVENTANTVDVVTIQYQVVVENVLDNQDNVKLNNNATISFTDPGDPNLLVSQDSSVEVTLGEPHLALSKTLLSSASGVDAGDLIEYQVVIVNDGSSPALNTVLTDVLPAGLLLNGTPVITANTGTFTLPIITTAGNQWATNPFQLPIAASMTLTIAAQIDTSVLPGDTIQNSIDATFSSHASNGRNGDDPNADQDDDQILDNYAVTNAAQTIVINDPIAIHKSFAPNAGQTTYTIGEHLTYRLQIDLLEGSVNNVQVFDSLPAGMRFIASTVSVGNIGMNLQLPGNAVENGQILSINFGNISNPANGNNSDDHVVIDIEVVIEDIGANQDSFVLDNNASVHFDGANGPEIRDFDNDSNAPGSQPLSLTLVEPELTITKSVNPKITPPGQVVRFTLVIDHTANSSADAFDLEVVDTLPVGMSFVTGSASQAVQVNGQQLTFTIAALTLLDGQTTISYDAMIANNAVLQQVLTNQAQLTYSTQAGSNPDERFYNDTDSAGVTPDSATVLDAVKTVSVIDDGDTAGQLNPGDIVEYTVVINNQGAIANQLVFTDVLPAQLSYIPGSMTSSLGVADDSLAPQLSVTLGNLASGQQFTVAYQAQIAAGVSAGSIIANQGVIDSNETLPEPTDVDGIDANGDQPTTIQIGAINDVAAMTVNKSFQLTNDLVAPANTINEGDEITYDIVIRNTGTVDLTNLSLSDIVPSGTQPTGVQVTQITTNQGTAPAASNAVFIADIGTLFPGQSVTISIRGIVTGTGVLSNQATVSSTETGDQLSDANTDATDGTQPTTFPISPVNVSGQPQLAVGKTVVSQIDTNSDLQVNPGETVRFSVVVTNTGNAIANAVQINDPLSGLNADLVPGSVFISQGNLLSTSPVLTVDAGNLLPGAQLTVDFDMIARDPGVLSNSVTATDQQGNNATADAAIDVMVFDPFDPPHGTKIINADGLPELEWTMVWINPNTIYTMPLQVIDPIPANATYVANSVVCVAHGSSEIIDCSFDSANNQIVMNGLIGADGNAQDAASANNEITITLRTRVDNLALNVVNQGRAFWDIDGDGTVDDDVLSQNPVLTDEPAVTGTDDPTVWNPARQPSVKPIPTLSEWGMIMLMLMFLGVAAIQLQGRMRY